MARLKRLDHVVVAVQGLEEAAQAWEHNLGLKVERVVQPEGSNLKLAMLPAGNAFVELAQPLAADHRLASFMEERGEGMFSLSAEQMALNQMMGGLLQAAMHDAMSEQSRAERSRMAGTQRSIMERYEELQKELERRSDTPMRTENAAEEMQEVIRDLESGKISNETLEKQDRILSRMLDGSQSMTKRDFNRKRIAEKENLLAHKPSPGEILMQELHNTRAPVDLASYPEEYRSLIKKYLQKKLLP